MDDVPVESLLRAVPAEDVMDHVARLSSYDRYQASLGLERAAGMVADAAEAAGLTDVTVDRYAADGRPQWWSFRAPVSWTPLTARLTVHPGKDTGAPPVLRADHAEQPFTVATYSAPTPAGGVTAPLVRLTGTEPPGPGLAGAVAVVDRAAFVRGSLLAELTAAGALGLVTDAPWKGADDDQHPGRIELPPDSALFGFSLTPDGFRRLAAAADRGAVARAEVTVDRTAAMPVVSGVLPGDGTGGEIWLTAHLCHPRPSANDNASGVAALLGAAAALSRVRRADARTGARHAIRFFWGAEFLGNAAVLHGRSQPGGGPLPEALINLDMVGEDQALCRSPFVVERPPETTPTLLAPLAEHVVDRVFAATAHSPGTWSPSPFLGFSDHALYADPSVDRPAVQFCHPADRFNHSAADTPDKVSQVEMVRATAAGAALAHVLASGGPSRTVLTDVVDRWCEGERAAAEATVRRLGRAGTDWGRGLADHVARRTAALRALAAGAPAAEARALAEGRSGDPGTGRPGGGRPVHRNWEGPLNLRAMLGALPPATRDRLGGMIAEDKHHLSVLFNLAIRADGRRDRAAVVADTSYGLRRPLRSGTTALLFDALLESGWLAES
ncbi:M28 family peptidase [Streptomyces glaucus]|uniref:Peptidase M28 domain-containing protein n=1 Tax=Streptomyces glaucus TaxID=284029 RepID=A0ABN3J554_9ACTN